MLATAAFTTLSSRTPTTTVRKAGALLEDIAPGSGRPGKTQTGLVFYSETLTGANMKDDTALNWRAASKFGAAREKGRLRIQDVCRRWMGIPSNRNVATSRRSALETSHACELLRPPTPAGKSGHCWPTPAKPGK